MNKSITCLLFCLLTYLSTKAQDTCYYNVDWEKVASLEEAYRYTLTECDDIDTNKVVSYTYYASGQMEYITPYEDYANRITHGKSMYWSPEGILTKEHNFKHGKWDGDLKTYWEDGQFRRHDVFKEGELVEGKCWDRMGKEVSYHDYQVLPEFPGGMYRLFKFLKRKVKYPNKARLERTEGKVMVSFVVKKNGSVSNAVIVKSVSPELDKEALRVVNTMPKWKPGLIEGEIEQIRFTLPFKFQLTN